MTKKKAKAPARKPVKRKPVKKKATGKRTKARKKAQSAPRKTPSTAARKPKAGKKVKVLSDLQKEYAQAIKKDGIAESNRMADIDTAVP